MSFVEQAKDLLLSIPDVDFSKRYFESALNNYSYNNYNIEIKEGAFRVTIIPKDKPFIIKTLRYIHRRECLDFYYELEIFSRAKKDGLSEWFAEPFGSFVLNGVDFLVFEKADYTVNESYEDTELAIPEYSHPYIAEFVEYVEDLNTAKRLVDFIKRNRIVDLHMGNVGYSLAKKHILFLDYGMIDYCYHDRFWRN